MRKTLVFIVLLSLTSCLTIYFEQPQPAGSKVLTSFPAKMQGAYTSNDEGKDTAYVLTDRYVFFENEEKFNGTDTVEVEVLREEILSTNLVLKKQGKYYVLNDKEDGKDYWNVYLLNIQKNGDIAVMLTGDFETEEDTIQLNDPKKSLNEFFDITEFQKLDKNEYLVNPTRKEFKKLIKQGLFSDTLLLRRVEAPIPLKVKPSE